MKKAVKLFAVLVMVLSLCASSITALAGNSDIGVDFAEINQFKAGVYGGISFESMDDVVNYYVKAYDYTKSLTTSYTDNGKKIVDYKLLGNENFEIGDIYVDGKVNAILNKLVPGVASILYTPKTCGLSPSYSRNPSKDNNKKDNDKKNYHDFRKSMLKTEDILACNVADNNDGTVIITIQPKGSLNSASGEDSQGRFFSIPFNFIDSLKNGIPFLSFSQGNFKSNSKIIYKGGTAKVKINTKTNEIVEADYNLKCSVSLSHANVTVIKDKNITFELEYQNHYPDNDYAATRRMKNTVPRISSVKPGVKKITLKWNRVKGVNGVNGYQVKYSRKKNMKSAKKKSFKGAKLTKATLSGLKSKKTYYVRIRAYKIINGEKVFTKWSKIKKVKTK